MIGIEQHMLCDGVHFRSVRDTKFKTFRISVNFLLPLRRETAAANALLPYLLFFFAAGFGGWLWEVLVYWVQQSRARCAIS